MGDFHFATVGAALFLGAAETAGGVMSIQIGLSGAAIGPFMAQNDRHRQEGDSLAQQALRSVAGGRARTAGPILAPAGGAATAGKRETLRYKTMLSKGSVLCSDAAHRPPPVPGLGLGPDQGSGGRRSPSPRDRGVGRGRGPCRRGFPGRAESEELDPWLCPAPRDGDQR